MQFKKREMLNGVPLLVNSCFKDRAIPSAENHGECLDIPPCRRPNRIFTVPWSCSAFGGFEPSVEGETASVPREARQSYPPA